MNNTDLPHIDIGFERISLMKPEGDDDDLEKERPAKKMSFFKRKIFKN